jgi:geranylgeranyl pyrophosphate synthase
MQGAYVNSTFESGSVTAMRLAVDNSLAALLGSELGGLPGAVADPVRHAVLSPGKRIRPLLVMAAYDATGGDRPGITELACSVELVHAYSLVHDDLPCMDDDVLRRGQPTLHVRYGVATAVLAGAALMPLAVRAIVRAGSRLSLDEGTARRLISTLARASGAAGMVGGQLLDLCAEGNRVSREELEAIYLGKTAELIAASVVMGGIAAGAREVTLETLGGFGRTLGMAFQAVDDILDMRGTARELGKESGRDVQLGKATYPSIFGLSEAERISREFAEAASRRIDALERADKLREIARYVIDRRY